MPESKLTHFTTVFRADDSHRIRRNRSAVSCTACQRRKSKCDRQQPCGACVKRNDVASCHFEKAAPSAASNKKELQVRLSKLEQMVKGFADAPVPAAETLPGDEASYSDGSDQRSADHTVLKGRNTGDGVESCYHGATSWAALMSGIRDIQSLLATDGSFDADEGYVEEYSEDPDLLLGGITSITIEEVINSLPSRQDADRLITAYFNARFIALPYLHVHQFRRRYEMFWQNPQSVDFLWISILFSVFAFGSSVTQTTSPTTILPTVANAKFYLSKSAQCLIAGHYLRAKPYSVEAVIIHAHCRNVHKVDCDSTLWSVYGIAVRLAQKRGYHRDPRRISLQLTPFEAEMRRRVWFVIQSSDVLFSFQHGMPSIIDDGLCDADPPSNLTDEDFDEDTQLPRPRPPTDPLPILAFSYKATLARIMRRVVRNALCVEPQPYSHIVALQEDHEKWYAALPPCLRIRSIADTAFTDQNYTIMHRLMLEMMYLKSLCVLHRPYLSAYKHDAKYDSSRRICRESAVKILNHHVEFDLAMRPGGRMYEDRHMVASLTYHHFLMAAMVLCIDLSESPDYSLEDRSSHIHLLHSIHSIWASRDSESKDAKYASQVLRAVLNNVDTPLTMTPDGPTPSTDTSSTGISDTSLSEALPMLDSHIPNTSENIAVNFDDFPPIESLFGNGSEIVDWRSLDQYLRMNHSLIDLDTWDP